MRYGWLQLALTGWHTRLVAAGLACLLAPATFAWQFRDVTPNPEPPVEEFSEGGYEAVPQGVSEAPGATILEIADTPDEVADGTAVTEMQPGELTDESVLADGPLEPIADGALAADDETLPPSDDPADAVEVGEALAQQTESRAETNEPLIRPVRFQGIIVGKSTDEALIGGWGEPFKASRGADYVIYKYRIRPFRQVDVTVIDTTVTSILIHLDEPLDPVHCAEQLGLAQLDGVPIPDEFGKVLGLCYPERGVLFSFAAEDPESLVTKISLEPIGPEPFVLRALYDFRFELEKNLADLDRAIAMDGRYAEAYWLKATKLEAAGRYRDALESASQAIHFDNENPLYRLCHARLLHSTGSHEAALREVERVLAMADLPTELRAQGELQLGDLIAGSDRPRYKEAMEHHLAAIDLAAALASDRRFVPRRMAKDVLVHAHLSVARNISRGEYERQTEVAPKWLSRARALVEERVNRDQGDEMLRLLVYRAILATAADLQNGDDPSGVIEEMLREGRRQLAATEDPLNQSRIEWALGEGVAEAVRLQRLRGANEMALQHSDQALVLLQKAAKRRQSTPGQRYVVGRLYFHTGSLNALHRQDHREAILWYEKAYPLLAGEVPRSVLAQPRVHGESFISMGVSYWKQGNRQRGIDLTEHGTDLLQQAVVDGLLPSDALVIPYGNLASMHKQMGNHSDGKAFAELAASVQTDQPTRR